MKCDGPASEGGNAGTPLLSHCRSLRGRVGEKADGRADDTLMRGIMDILHNWTDAHFKNAIRFPWTEDKEPWLCGETSLRTSSSDDITRHSWSVVVRGHIVCGGEWTCKVKVFCHGM